MPKCFFIRVLLSVMKLAASIFLGLLIWHSGLSQLAEPIAFRTRSFDFGDVSEKGGSVSHEFQFTNLSGRPFRILSVQPSCGCTTPAWTKEIVQPGKVGFITATFDPTGRPGYFNKTLTLTTDLDTNPIVLAIKGNVVTSRETNDASEWVTGSGSWRLRSAAFNLGKQYINKEPITVYFPVLNSSSESIQVKKTKHAAYFLVEAPAELKPNQSGKIGIRLLAKQKGQYGFLNESIEFETSDPEQPIKIFSVYATVEEFFPTLTAEAVAQAPALNLEKESIDMGSVKSGNEYAVEVVLKNIGKKELLVRSLQSNCACLTWATSSQRISAGGELKLKITLTVPDRTGPLQKALTIYSNDPQKPVQRITVIGLVGQ